MKTTKQKANGKSTLKTRTIATTQAKTLDEIWGKKYSKFGTTDPEEYFAKISGMTRMDLQKECIRVGLYPNDRRDIMIERLQKACKRDLALAATSGKLAQPVKANKAANKILQKNASGVI